MKTISSFFLLLSLIIITSCGGQKTAATLEVTSGALTASNSAYEGGLVIMGKSGSNSFTIPVIHSAGSSSSVTVELPKGSTWKFSAVAWDGSPTKFSGTVKCDEISVNLDSDTKTVNLKLDNSKCFGTNFGEASYNSGTNFDMLRVITCGWLYEDSAGSVPVSSTTSFDYCTSGATTPLDQVRREHAQSIKIEIPEIIAGETKRSNLWVCLNGGGEGVFNGSTKQIPSSGLPVRILLFENSTCDETDPEDIRGDYSLLQGLANQIPGQSSFLNDNSGGINIFLPFNPVQAGYSNFIALLPKIFCSSGHCNPNPPSFPNSEDRIIQSEQDFVLVENPVSGQTCNEISSITPSGFSLTVAFNKVTDCYTDEEGRIRAKLKFSGTFLNKSITVAWSDSSWDFAMNVTAQYTGRLFNLLYRTVGFDPNGAEPSYETQMSLPSLLEDGDFMMNKNGILSRIRDLMEVDGPAGVLYPISCAQGFTKEKIVSVREDGLLKSFKIIFKDSDKTISSNEEYTGDPNTQNGDPYKKKIITQERLPNGSYVTRETLDFMCSGFQMGVYEAQKTENGVLNRVKIFFNTINPALPANSKVLYYRSSERKVGGVIQEYSAEQILLGNTAANEIRANRFSVFIKYVDGTNWDYKTLKQQVDVKSSGTMGFLEAADPQTLPGSANANFDSTIASASWAIRTCSNGDFTDQIFSTVCTANSSTFDQSVSWDDMLPGGAMTGVFTAPAAFPAAM